MLYHLVGVFKSYISVIVSSYTENIVLPENKKTNHFRSGG